MTSEWYWRRGDQINGPISRRELDQLWEKEIIKANDEIRRGAGAWRPAATIGDAPSTADSGPSPIRSGRRLMGNRLTLLIAIVALAVLLFKDRLNADPSYENILHEYEQIIAKMNMLVTATANDDEWAAFQKESQDRLQPINEQLEELCERYPRIGKTMLGDKSDHDYKTLFVRARLLQIGKHQLPKVIENARAGKPVGGTSLHIERTMHEVGKALEKMQGGSPSADDEK